MPAFVLLSQAPAAKKLLFSRWRFEPLQRPPSSTLTFETTVLFSAHVFAATPPCDPSELTLNAAPCEIASWPAPKPRSLKSPRLCFRQCTHLLTLRSRIQATPSAPQWHHEHSHSQRKLFPTSLHCNQRYSVWAPMAMLQHWNCLSLHNSLARSDLLDIPFDCSPL